MHLPSSTPSRQALVLDADQRSALAVVRSLGRAGLTVTVADTRRGTLAAHSRHAARELVYPDPTSSPAAFQAWLRAQCQAAPGAFLVPCTDLTLPQAQAALVDAPGLAACWPTPTAYDQLSDKWRLYELGTTLGVPLPHTQLERAGPAPAWAGRYPMMVKPRRSVMMVGGAQIKLPVCGARSGAELSTRMSLFPPGAELLFQEAVSGDGFGLSAVCDRGAAVAWFAHRRLREMPPAGGVSTLCESIAVPERYRRHCERLIEATAWHGPAMFEFKGDPTGEAWLIEVNGRLWGSVQLAIDCGVDVPLLMYSLACGEQLPAAGGYATGRRLRWLFGDLSHLYLVLRGRRLPDPPPGRLRTLAQVLLEPDGQRWTEDWRYGDRGPFWYQLRREAGLVRRS